MEVQKNDNIQLNQIANLNLIRIVFLTTLIVVLSILFEVIKGGRSLTEWVINSGILLITTISIYIIYKKDKENDYIKYIVFGGYIIVWAYIYITGRSSIVSIYKFICIVWKEKGYSNSWTNSISFSNYKASYRIYEWKSLCK